MYVAVRTPAGLARPDSTHIPAATPLAFECMTVLVTLITVLILAVCITLRWPGLRALKSLPIMSWLTLAIYFDCLTFVLTTATVRYGLDTNRNEDICSLAIWFCLIFYLSSKLMIYIYFTERAYLVWGSRAKRYNDKLYITNFIVVIGAYVAIIILQFVFRISRLAPNGFCIIGMQRKVILPLIAYEILINLYLLGMFLYPLRKLYSYQTRGNPKLQQMAKRSVIGTVVTLTASGANLSAVAILDGEKAWICLLFCNLDILMCSLVLHWLTGHEEKPATNTTNTIHQARRSGSSKPFSRQEIWGVTSEVSCPITSASGPIQPEIPSGITVLTEQSQRVEPVIGGIPSGEKRVSRWTRAPRTILNRDPGTKKARMSQSLLEEDRVVIGPPRVFSRNRSLSA